MGQVSQIGENELRELVGGWQNFAKCSVVSTQYGMVMLLLALLYGIALMDPLRYIRVLWVAIAEQALGIGYAIYIYLGIGNVTLGQIGIQSVINVSVIALLVLFWRRLRDHDVPVNA